MTVYIDGIFIINFTVNYLLSLATAKICAVYARRVRMVLAALFGAVYSVAAVLDVSGIASNIFIKIAVGTIMVLISFGNKKPLLRIALVFGATAAGFAGVVMAISLLGGSDVLGGGLFLTPSFEVLLLSFAVSYMVFSLIFRRVGRSKTKISEIDVHIGVRNVKFKALQDTGNSLTDPLTGKAVIVADMNTVNSLFSEKTGKILNCATSRNAVEIFERLNREEAGECKFHLVPYKAVGTECGMLIGFSPDRIFIDGKEEKFAIIAVSPNSISDGGAYSALMGAA